MLEPARLQTSSTSKSRFIVGLLKSIHYIFATAASTEGVECLFREEVIEKLNEDEGVQERRFDGSKKVKVVDVTVSSVL